MWFFIGKWEYPEVHVYLANVLIFQYFLESKIGSIEIFFFHKILETLHYVDFLSDFLYPAVWRAKYLLFISDKQL